MDGKIGIKRVAITELDTLKSYKGMDGPHHEDHTVFDKFEIPAGKSASIERRYKGA